MRQASLAPKLKLTLLAAFSIAALIFWVARPGLFSPDSHTVFESARTGLYSAHHPPINALVWGFLHQIQPGGSLLLLLQLVLLWGGIGCFAASVPKPYHLGFYFIGLWPPILIYGLFLWKDMAFSFSYLAVSGVLSYLTYRRKRPGLTLSLFFLCLIFYGTAAKYQARFVLIWQILWYLSLLLPQAKLSQRVVLAGLLSLLGIQAVDSFNQHLVAPGQDLHSWQYVKLYDLSGMTLISGYDLIPDNYKNANYTRELLARHYNRVAADNIFEGLNPEAVLHISSTPSQRQKLLSHWRAMVLHHPLAYLQHRMGVWLEMLSEPILAQAWPRVLKRLQAPRGLYSVVVLFSYWPILLIQIVITYASIRRYNRSPFFPAIIYLSAMALSYCVFLAFFSMAAPPRYLYFAYLMSLCTWPLYASARKLQTLDDKSRMTDSSSW